MLPFMKNADEIADEVENEIVNQLQGFVEAMDDTPLKASKLGTKLYNERALQLELQGSFIVAGGGPEPSTSGL